MKIKINNYTFDKTLGQITFDDYTSVNLDNVLLITNVSSNIIIYNFADNTLGGTISGNILTLTYNTTLMNSNDSLQIFYDDGTTPSSNEVLMAIFELASRLEALSSMRGIQNDMRVTPTNTARTITSGTINTVSNISSVGGYASNQQVFQLQNQTAIQSNINNIKITIT